jgi:hypothetical protein
MHRTSPILAALLCMLDGGSFANAQQPAAASAGALARGELHSDIELTRSIVATKRQAIVANALELTLEESQAFWPLYREYDAERGLLRDQLAQIVLRYEQLVPNLTADEADRVTRMVLDIQAQEIAIRQRYLARFQKALAEIKTARFYQIESKLDAAISMELARSVPLIW